MNHSRNSNTNQSAHAGTHWKKLGYGIHPVVTLIACGAFVISGAAALPGAANAQDGRRNVHTCVMQVSTKSANPGGSGTMSLGADKQVYGATLQDAASMCHQFTRDAFQGNAGWYNPGAVCGRYPNTSGIEVMASDFFRDMGNSGGVNFVDGYKINCGGPAVWDHTLHVVSGTL